MFIRQTRTNNIATGESYFTYRLVRGERVAGKVRQITLLNLGRHFPIKQQDWPLLCSRIEQLLHPQADCSPLRCGAHLERAAQRYFGQLIARAPLAAAADSLEETVTLFDLTNTYFEGQAAVNPKAKNGRSKEMRSDCPLVTMGLVLDGSGFVRRSDKAAGREAL